MCWILNRVSPSFPNSIFSDISLVPWNQPWWEYLHNSNWQTIKKISPSFLTRTSFSMSTPLLFPLNLLWQFTQTYFLHHAFVYFFVYQNKYFLKTLSNLLFDFTTWLSSEVHWPSPVFSCYPSQPQEKCLLNENWGVQYTTLLIFWLSRLFENSEIMSIFFLFLCIHCLV